MIEYFADAVLFFGSRIGTVHHDFVPVRHLTKVNYDMTYDGFPLKSSL